MCHRQLKFDNHVPCGHLTFTGDTNLDCHKPDCFNSLAHPAQCEHVPPGKSQCTCKRYYSYVRTCFYSRRVFSPILRRQPERIYTDVRCHAQHTHCNLILFLQVLSKCARCSAAT
ncbi:hypothetical protein BC835DRAFT_1267388 [Cytidiella melzeri]|nr:hypothetical protein BC835DRAFT_1267388 [Cytidiella melzeri]